MAISRSVPMLAMPFSYGIPLWSNRTHDTRIPPLYKPLFPSVAVAFNEPRGTYISVSSGVPFVPVRCNDGSAVLIATPFDFDLATFTENKAAHVSLIFESIFNDYYCLFHIIIYYIAALMSDLRP